MSPARFPVTSNMHTESPGTLTNKMNILLEDLKANPPKFIVDSQKMHFPYYSHPVFDLWPRIYTKPQTQRGVFDLRVQYSPPSAPIAYLPSADLEKALPRLLAEIEAFTVMLLTHRDPRWGGPLPNDQAQNRAKTERNRHLALQPLRQFVMENYKPVVPVNSPMYVFEYQGDRAASNLHK